MGTGFQPATRVLGQLGQTAGDSCPQRGVACAHEAAVYLMEMGPTRHAPGLAEGVYRARHVEQMRLQLNSHATAPPFSSARPLEGRPEACGPAATGRHALSGPASLSSFPLSVVRSRGGARSVSLPLTFSKPWLGWIALIRPIAYYRASRGEVRRCWARWGTGSSYCAHRAVLLWALPSNCCLGHPSQCGHESSSSGAVPNREHPPPSLALFASSVSQWICGVSKQRWRVGGEWVLGG
jgi:hypothetical protein